MGQFSARADRARRRTGRMTVEGPSGSLPAPLAAIVDIFAASTPRDRLELLMEYSQQVPPLPDRLRQHPDRLEPVPECQSPLFVVAEVDGSRYVHLFMDAPPEAPTTRGFAGIFHSGLDGLSAEQVLEVPDDVTTRLSLAEVVSPLRLRGATALLRRIKGQVSRQL